MKSRTVSEIKNELNEPLREKKPFSIEAMKLLVHVEMRRRAKSGEPPLNCVVIDGNNKAEYQQFLENLKKQANELIDPARLQVMIKQGAHYTAIDIELSKSGNKFFVLDAANDPRGTMRHISLAAIRGDNGEPFFAESYTATGTQKAGGNIQKDMFSCPAFTLDHVCQVSKIENLYDVLQERSQEFGVIEWVDLPPSLVWNAQSMKIAEEYTNKRLNFVSEFYSDGKIPDNTEVDRRISEGYSLQDHISASQKVAVVNGQEKLVNASVEKSFAEHQKRARSFLDRHTKKTVESIVNSQGGLQLVIQPDHNKNDTRVESVEATTRAPRR